MGGSWYGVSMFPHSAVAMARFVLKHSASDWTDRGGIDIDSRTA